MPITMTFSSTSIALGASAASTTLTHGLGIAPTWVYLQNRTSTGAGVVLSSTSQIVLMSSLGVGSAIVDVLVECRHALVA